MNDDQKRLLKAQTKLREARSLIKKVKGNEQYIVVRGIGMGFCEAVNFMDDLLNLDIWESIDEDENWLSEEDLEE